MSDLKLEGNSLSDYQKVLEELGFEAKYCNYLDSELVGVDWIKDEECITTGCCYSKEYDEYIRNLPVGTPFIPDWSRCEVHEIVIKTKEFGYPEGVHDYEGNWVGDIRLVDEGFYDNFCSLSLEYFLKALWMSRNPISAKNEIVKGFVSETGLFLKKHGPMLERLGFVERGNTLLCVGYEISQTEPYLEYAHQNSYCLGDITLGYNMFTGKLYWTKFVKNDNPWRPNLHYQVNVNDITTEEFELLLTEYLKEQHIL